MPDNLVDVILVFLDTIALLWILRISTVIHNGVYPLPLNWTTLFITIISFVIGLSFNRYSWLMVEKPSTIWETLYMWIRILGFMGGIFVTPILLGGEGLELMDREPNFFLNRRTPIYIAIFNIFILLHLICTSSFIDYPNDNYGCPMSLLPCNK